MRQVDKILTKKTKPMKKDLSYNSNASPECIEAAKKLIDLYRSITVEEVKRRWRTMTMFNIGGLVAKRLTGFGQKNRCLLCQSIKRRCNSCIYSGSRTGYLFCNFEVHEKSYCDIENADTPRKLVNAMKRRANHIENILKAIEKHNKI